MKKYKNDLEYLSIINPIMENKEFRKMDEIKHHNTTRLDHLLKVSYYSYIISKKLMLKYSHREWVNNINKVPKQHDNIYFEKKREFHSLMNCKYFEMMINSHDILCEIDTRNGITDEEYNIMISLYDYMISSLKYYCKETENGRKFAKLRKVKDEETCNIINMEIEAKKEILKNEKEKLKERLEKALH